MNRVTRGNSVQNSLLLSTSFSCICIFPFLAFPTLLILMTWGLLASCPTLTLSTWILTANSCLGVLVRGDSRRRDFLASLSLSSTLKSANFLYPRSFSNSFTQGFCCDPWFLFNFQSLGISTVVHFLRSFEVVFFPFVLWVDVLRLGFESLSVFVSSVVSSSTTTLWHNLLEDQAVELCISVVIFKLKSTPGLVDVRNYVVNFFFYNGLQFHTLRCRWFWGPVSRESTFLPLWRESLFFLVSIAVVRGLDENNCWVLLFTCWWFQFWLCCYSFQNFFNFFAFEFCDVDCFHLLFDLPRIISDFKGTVSGFLLLATNIA